MGEIMDIQKTQTGGFPFEAYALFSKDEAKKGEKYLVLTSARTIRLNETVDPEKRTTWIHVAPFGEWKGYVGPDGELSPFTLDKKCFESVLTDQQNTVTPKSVDYEHASLTPTGGPTPAAGRVEALEIREDGLYALVKFTPRAAELIKGEEYQYCSPVFVWNAPDRKTGEEIYCHLDSIALTNRPFLDGQNPIVLSRRLTVAEKISPKSLSRKESKPMSDMSKIRAALKTLLEELGEEESEPKAEGGVKDAPKPEEAKSEAPNSEEQKSEEPKAEDDKKELADPPAAEGEPAKAEQSAEESEEENEEAESADAAQTDLTPGDLSQQDANTDFLTQIAAASKKELKDVVAALSAEGAVARLAEFLFAQPEGTGAAMTALSVNVLSTQLSAANAELKKYKDKEKKEQEAALTAEVDALISSGRLHPASRAEMTTLAVQSPKEFRALTKHLTPTLPVADVVTASKVTPAAPESQSLDTKLEEIIPDNDPLVIALNAEFDRAGVKDKAIRNNHIRKALSAQRGR